MGDNAYIGGVIVCLGYLIAGARLFRLSLRTHKAPERLLSVALLLWGLTGAFWMVYELAYPIQQIEFDATGSFSASMDAIVSFVELIPIACIWLVFFPPTIYQRWIERFDSDPRVAEG